MSIERPPNEEVGYLLLKECDLLLLGTQCPSRGQWLDIDFRQPMEEEENADTNKTDENNVCTRGTVIIENEDGGGDARLKLKNFPRFDGTMKDVPHSSQCPSCCSMKQKNRSDASLLLGVAMTCQDNGHIQIETMQIMLGCAVNAKEASNRSSVVGNQKASFLVTFSVAWLNRNTKFQQGRQKVMPPSTQLLFALLRSDWDYLSSSSMTREKSIRRFRSGGLLDQETFFPSVMSLEELYSRIRGLQTNKGQTPSTDQTSPLSLVPTEVLQENIAPFLRARSLHSLRCTCSDLYQILKGVVPGLKLRLFPHQVRSLEWMRGREVCEWTENHVLDSRYRPLSTDGDCHRAVTAGATVLLRSRDTPRQSYRLDSRFGIVMKDVASERDDFYLSRKVARGGLLCDDPGLGKTVTVFSLILQTMGLSSEKHLEKEEVLAEENLSEDCVFGVYWKEQVDPIFQRRYMNRLSRELQRMDLYFWFRYPVSSEAYSDYYDIIKEPMCFKDVYKRVDNNLYANKFEMYIHDVELIFRNAMIYNSPNDDVYELAKDMLADFKLLLSEFKTSQVQSATKSFSSSNARPNSSVAAILERKALKEYMDSLIPSAATLLVVPETLLSHWVEQITMHLDLRYWTTKDPIIFEFKANDSKTKERMKELRLNTSVLKTQSALIFIDRTGTAKLPDPDFLALFTVMLTTTKRFVHEWKNGSFAEELKRDDGHISPYAVYRSSGPGSCPLLKIHWTRMVIDEGHVMGRGKQNNAILFASWITANRRWSMTGTPTPQTASRSGMSNLLGLMAFMKHEFFTARLDGDRAWQFLSRSWNDGSLSSFFAVKSLLAVLMMRHTKLDIPELPPPRYQRIWLDMSPNEVHTFNTLVCAVQSNLLLTTMKGKTSGLQDSLLHKSQAKFARQAFGNLRLACSGGLRVVPQISQKNWRETVELLEAHGIHGVKQKIVLNYMQRAVTEQISQCMVCGVEVSTLLILPCGDLLCTECLKGPMRSCVVCSATFDVDDFQLLQPGINYEWYDYYKQEQKLKAITQSDQEEDTLPAGDVVENNEQANLAGQIALQPAVPTRRTKKPGDGHDCEYSVAAGDGKCKLCHHEHEDCVMISPESNCTVCYRKSELCPPEESKFHYIIKRLDHLHLQKGNHAKVFSPAAASFAGEQVSMAEDRPLKVIIFSQFRKVLNLVGHRLLRRYGAGAVAEFWGSYRRQELAKFKINKDCFCMLLSRDGSEGLDLSFVTHIFFLEEIWDKSLQDQAVARAWRMGAKGHVEVETLLAKKSIEALMTNADEKMASMAQTRDMESKTSKDIMRSKMVFILESLRLMRRGQQGVTKRKTDEGDENIKSEKKQRVRFAD